MKFIDPTEVAAMEVVEDAIDEGELTLQVQLQCVIELTYSISK